MLYEMGVLLKKWMLPLTSSTTTINAPPFQVLFVCVEIFSIKQLWHFFIQLMNELWFSSLPLCDFDFFFFIKLSLIISMHKVRHTKLQASGLHSIFKMSNLEISIQTIHFIYYFVINQLYVGLLASLYLTVVFKIALPWSGYTSYMIFFWSSKALFSAFSMLCSPWLADLGQSQNASQIRECFIAIHWFPHRMYFYVLF